MNLMNDEVHWILFVKSGLISRSSAATESDQCFGTFGIKSDVLKNFLTERASRQIRQR